MAQHSQFQCYLKQKPCGAPSPKQVALPQHPAHPDSCGASLLALGASKGPAVKHRTSVKRLGILLLTSDHHPHRQGAPH